MKDEFVLISVLLPVYNAEKTIAEAIESILKQTYSDFEFIIINDGSTDRSEQIIRSYTDSRIKYYSNDGNKGLIYTLNRGIELASGKYIARMDADDVSLPKRFEKQIQLMEEHDDVIVCGTLIKGFGNHKAKKFNYIAPEHSEAIKRRLIIEAPMAHPTVMIRKSVLINDNIRYNSNYQCAEDYKLWIDLAPLGKFYNIQEVLLLYRLSDTQVTQKGNIKQIESSKKCRREYLCNFIDNEYTCESIMNSIVDICTISNLKKKDCSVEILNVLYLSLYQYSIKELNYFIFSLDWIKLKPQMSFAILKRFVMGKNPVL